SITPTTNGVSRRALESSSILPCLVELSKPYRFVVPSRGLDDPSTVGRVDVGFVEGANSAYSLATARFPKPTARRSGPAPLPQMPRGALSPLRELHRAEPWLPASRSSQPLRKPTGRIDRRIIRLPACPLTRQADGGVSAATGNH